MKDNNKLDKKSKQLIVGIFSLLILITFSVVMLIAAYDISKQAEEDTTAAFNNSTSYVQPENSKPSGNSNAFVATKPNNTPSENSGVPQTTAAKQEEVISVEGLEEFTKTGDNQISDSPDNKFIKLITSNYAVEPEYLVAIYAVPDLGNNFVLQFDNQRDSEGKVVRSPKTLKKIYHINKDEKITVATGKPTGNEGVDYGTSIMTYYLVTDVVMPEFPDYFTGVS